MGRRRETSPIENGHDNDAEPLLGTVRMLNGSRGFGFIKAVTGEDHFFHRSAAPDFELLRIGASVEFLPKQTPKGPRAESIVLLQ